MDELENKKSISLSEIWLIVRSNIIWIFLIMFICLAIGVGYTYFFKKTTYTATVGVHVQAEYYYDDEGLQQKLPITTAYQYSVLLAPEYEKVMRSDEVLIAANKMNVEHGYKPISSGALRFNYTEESYAFTISYTTSQLGGNASQIKRDLVDSLNEYVKNSIEIIDMTNNGVDTYKFLKDNLTVYSEARIGNVSVSKGATTTIMLAFIIGLILSCAFVVIIYLVDDTISSKEEIERLSGLTTLALVDIGFNAQQSLDNSNKGGKA